jgi:hypothetical protein
MRIGIHSRENLKLHISVHYYGFQVPCLECRITLFILHIAEFIWSHENSIVISGGYKMEHLGSNTHFLTKLHKEEIISNSLADSHTHAFQEWSINNFSLQLFVSLCLYSSAIINCASNSIEQIPGDKDSRSVGQEIRILWGKEIISVFRRTSRLILPWLTWLYSTLKPHLCRLH